MSLWLILYLLIFILFLRIRKRANLVKLTYSLPPVVIPLAPQSVTFQLSLYGVSGEVKRTFDLEIVEGTRYVQPFWEFDKNGEPVNMRAKLRSFKGEDLGTVYATQTLTAKEEKGGN
jgi:hypothetical protein